MRNITASILLLAVLAGCSWRQTPVPVAGDTGSIAMLAGSWAGDYSSDQTGRSGNITFELAADKASAYGDILMIAKPGPQQVSGTERMAGAVQIQRATVEPLRIRFVRAESGTITGTLDPYKDPDCGCTLTTTFAGKFTGPDRIEGTFHSRGADFGHVPADGKWSVTRQKPGTQ